MRHLWYWLSLGAALFPALFLSLPFLMSECQLNTDPAEVRSCFAAAAVGRWAYGLGLLGFLGASLVLYVRGDGRAAASAVAVAIGPFATALAVTAVYRAF